MYLTVFSRVVATLPRYGNLKYTGHLLEPNLTGFSNFEIVLLIVFLITCDYILFVFCFNKDVFE